MSDNIPNKKVRVKQAFVPEGMFLESDPSELPIEPRTFDQVERHQSNLPIQRLKDFRSFAYRTFKEMPTNGYLSDDQQKILILAGYILQLTELNNNQK